MEPSVGEEESTVTPVPRPDEVVAVVVTTDPGPELEACLNALLGQDHPVALLVIDDASAVDPTARIAAVAPDAYVRRLDAIAGWAAAANTALDLVEGADWLLICHDDVAPAPDAVAELLNGAHEFGADIAVPKLVSWSHHDRLLSIGFGADRTARPVPIVEAGDLDQEQHDFARPVSAASGACLLISAARFRELGGFAAAMTRPPLQPPAPLATAARALSGPELGEDLDLCWRMLAAGGVVHSVPAARVAHAGRAHRSSESDQVVLASRVLAWRRNQVSTVLSVRSGFGLLSAVVALIFEWVVLRRRGLPLVAVRKAVTPTTLSGLVRRRTQVQGQKKFASRPVLPGASNESFESTLTSVSSRVRQQVSTELADDSALALHLAGGTVAASFRRGPLRVVSALAAGLLIAFVLGSRKVITGGLPRFGQFVPSASISELLSSFGTAWRPSGTGFVAPAAPAVLLAAIARAGSLWQDGFLRLVTTIGFVPIGAIGAGRLASLVVQLAEEQGESASDPTAGPVTLEQRRARSRFSLLAGLIAAAAYGASPVGIASLRTGSWEALGAMAMLPWLVTSLLRRPTPPRTSTGTIEQPMFSTDGKYVRPDARQLVASALRVGVPFAVVASFAPVMVMVLATVSVGLFGGWLVSGGRFDWRRLARRTINALVLVAVLWGAWTLEVVRSPSTLLGRGPTTSPVHVADIARLSTPESRMSTFGLGGWLSVGLLVAAVIAMLLLNGDRLRFAIRFWIMALLFGVLAWVTERGPLVGWLPSHEVLLVPVALGWAMVIALGVSGFLIDLRSTRFGWRQRAGVLAAVSVSLACAPLIVSAGSGSWGLPSTDHARELDWMSGREAEGAFRTLWIGSNSSMPIDGFSLSRNGERLRFALSLGGSPDIRSASPGAPRSGSQRVRTFIDDVWSGETYRVGASFGETAIRYVVLVDRPTPTARIRSVDHPVPADLVAAFDRQLDLRQVSASSGLRVYENTSWKPVASIDGRPAFVGVASNINTRDVLTTGTLDLRHSFDPRWELDGKAPVAIAPSNTMQFAASANPEGSVLRYRTSPVRLAVIWLQLLLWAMAFIGYVADFRSRRRHLQQLANEYDDVVIDLSDEDDPWDSALSMDGAFRQDEDAAVDFELVGAQRPNARAARTVSTAAEGSTRTQGVERGSNTTAPPASEDSPIDSVADQLWNEWTQRQAARQHPAARSTDGKSTDGKSTDESDGDPS